MAEQNPYETLIAAKIAKRHERDIEREAELAQIHADKPKKVKKIKRSMS
jgi:hypothetical protein